jgi:hypothetical protein
LADSIAAVPTPSRHAGLRRARRDELVSRLRYLASLAEEHARDATGLAERYELLRLIQTADIVLVRLLNPEGGR